MTDEVFGNLYSDSYDAFYATKDYETECDLLEGAFRRFGSAAIETVLDLGCGTGGHAIPLSKRGYRVTGVDRSPGMLKKASEKAGAGGPEFLEGDLRTLDLGRTFDAAVMMFAVLGYQVENEDVLAVLRAVEAGKGLEKVSEAHSMRFFFAKELELFLEVAGLRLRSLTAFGEPDRRPEETDWNVFVVAVKT